MASWDRPYVERLRARLLERHGGKCRDCGSRRKLEWAHLRPTGLSGRSRGSKHRLLDVRRHPDAYALLCRWCHSKMDQAAWGKGYDPTVGEEEVPF